MTPVIYAIIGKVIVLLLILFVIIIMLSFGSMIIDWIFSSTKEDKFLIKGIKWFLRILFIAIVLIGSIKIIKDIWEAL